jgi:hypothetical protein
MPMKTDMNLFKGIAWIFQYKKKPDKVWYKIEKKECSCAYHYHQVPSILLSANTCFFVPNMESYISAYQRQNNKKKVDKEVYLKIRKSVFTPS